MKVLLLQAALFLAVLAAPSPSNSILEEWHQYKITYGKFYDTPEEDHRRLEIYLERKRKIEEHNTKFERGETSYTMALNQFGDWFPEELSRLNGLKETKARSDSAMFQMKPDADLPKDVNWVEKGAVTEVKDQGPCGSCYAFSAVGALEGLMYRVNKTIIDLSVQELVDCSNAFGNNGCRGGYMTSCFDYVKNRTGIDSDMSYPYEYWQDMCRANQGSIAASCTNYVSIPPENEQALTQAVATVGPIAIGMAISLEFAHYASGIYNGNCSKNINHGMLAVGYGTDNETQQPYWLIKNSWGTSWGEEGYVRVIKDINKCGISDIASYPTYDLN